MPVTGGILRLIVSFVVIWRARASRMRFTTKRAPSPSMALGGNLARLAVDFDGDAGGVAEHDAQRAAAAHALHAAGARHVVEQSLAARIVDLDPAVVGEIELQARLAHRQALVALRLRGAAAGHAGAAAAGTLSAGDDGRAGRQRDRRRGAGRRAASAESPGSNRPAAGSADALSGVPEREPASTHQMASQQHGRARQPDERRDQPARIRAALRAAAPA